MYLQTGANTFYRDFCYHCNRAVEFDVIICQLKISSLFTEEKTFWASLVFVPTQWLAPVQIKHSSYFLKCVAQLVILTHRRKSSQKAVVVSTEHRMIKAGLKHWNK